MIHLARTQVGDKRIIRELTQKMEQFIKSDINSLDEFWGKIKEIFGEAPPKSFVRRCALIVNAFHASEVVSLKTLESPPPAIQISVESEKKLFIYDAYKRFTDYFLESNGIAHKMHQIQRADLARCLCCGDFLSLPINKRDFYGRGLIQNTYNHCRHCYCGMPVFLVLTGKRASAVIYYTQPHQTILEWGSIYQTKRGDQDIGLTLFDDLYLSEPLVKKLLKEMYDGTLYRNSKRRDNDNQEDIDQFLFF